VLGFIVESETIGPCLGKRLDVVTRVGDHEVAIEVRKGKVLAERGDDRGTDGEIGDEVTTWGRPYPSMISMCSVWAPAYTISWHSLKRNAKSAERMEGPIMHFLCSCCILSIQYYQSGYQSSIHVKPVDELEVGNVQVALTQCIRQSFVDLQKLFLPQ
jgi:hypothetical protein